MIFKEVTKSKIKELSPRAIMHFHLVLTDYMHEFLLFEITIQKYWSRYKVRWYNEKCLRYVLSILKMVHFYSTMLVV